VAVLVRVDTTFRRKLATNQLPVTCRSHCAFPSQEMTRFGGYEPIPKALIRKLVLHDYGVNFQALQTVASGWRGEW
jgi:hypothetical protein